MHLKEYEEAEKILLAIQSKSSSIDAEFHLAKLYFLQNKKDLALKQVEIIKSQIAEQIQHIENLAMLLIDNHQNEIALALAMENIDTFPESIPLHFVMAKVHADSGLFGETIEHCQFILQKTTKEKAKEGFARFRVDFEVLFF